MIIYIFVHYEHFFDLCIFLEKPKKKKKRLKKNAYYASGYKY